MASKKKKGEYDVISVGSATVDCFVDIPIDIRKIGPGSKILIDRMDMFTGGGGTNVAVGLARLGLKTGFIGELGEDSSADMIRHKLEKEDVDFLVRQHSRHRTAYSVVIEAAGKDRSILVYKGASSFLYSRELPKTMKTSWFYFASVMGKSFRTMEHIASFAKKNRINVYFNPSSYMVRQGLKFLKNVISATTVIAMNKEEAQILLKTKSDDHTLLLKRLAALGPEICVVTDGKKGVYIYADGKFYHDRNKNHQAVDTTGAGDAFGTGFLAGLIIKGHLPLDKRIRFAIRLGLADALSVVMHPGAKQGLLSRKRALASIKR